MKRTLVATLLLSLAALATARPQQQQFQGDASAGFGQQGGQQPNFASGGSFGGGFQDPTSSTFRPQPFPPAVGAPNGVAGAANGFGGVNGFGGANGGGMVAPTDNRPEWVGKLDGWWSNTKNVFEQGWNEARQGIGSAASDAKEWAKDRIDDIKDKLDDNNNGVRVGTDPRFNGEIPIQFPSASASQNFPSANQNFPSANQNFPSANQQVPSAVQH